jgi:hypothetical protein
MACQGDPDTGCITDYKVESGRVRVENGVDDDPDAQYPRSR